MDCFYIFKSLGRRYWVASLFPGSFGVRLDWAYKSILRRLSHDWPLDETIILPIDWLCKSVLQPGGWILH